MSGSIETLLSCWEKHSRAGLSQFAGDFYVNTLGHAVFMNICFMALCNQAVNF